MKKLFAKITKEKLKKYLKILIVLLVVAAISVWRRIRTRNRGI